MYPIDPNIPPLEMAIHVCTRERCDLNIFVRKEKESSYLSNMLKNISPTAEASDHQKLPVLLP